MKYIQKIWNALIQLLFPLRCPACDGILRTPQRGICKECEGVFRKISPPWCLQCGKKLIKSGNYCKDCRDGEHVFIRGRSLYEYSSCAEAVYRFKYSGRREYGEYFGREIAENLGDFIRGIKPDALIPIPLHKKRLRVRGYNQAEVLAKAIGKHVQVPVQPDLLLRVKNTSALKQLNPKERQNNLKKAFKLNRNDVKLNTTILIDDIYTTGATIDEATRTLKACGVREVYFITLAGGKAR